MILSAEIDTAGGAMTNPAGGAASMTPAEAATMNPTNALLVELAQTIEDLRLQNGELQAQVITLTQDAAKDPVCQVNELMQNGLLADVTESTSHTGPDHDRVHTCSWAIDGTLGEVITATADTVRQAKKNCALLYLEYYEQTA